MVKEVCRSKRARPLRRLPAERVYHLPVSRSIRPSINKVELGRDGFSARGSRSARFVLKLQGLVMSKFRQKPTEFTCERTELMDC